jgi:hypothetical protein
MALALSAAASVNGINSVASGSAPDRPDSRTVRDRASRDPAAAFARGNIAEPEERYYHDGTTCHGGVTQTKWLGRTRGGSSRLLLQPDFRYPSWQQAHRGRAWFIEDGGVVGGIFLSYRRDDNRHAAGRLYDCLQQRFSSEQIFFDVDAIEPGLSFMHVIEERIRASDAIIVVIGLNWLDARDGEGHRRLDDPEDFVRVEIAAGLQQGIRVIPVLIDGAAIPREADLPTPLKALASKNAVTLSHSSFQRDAEHLNIALSRVVESKKAPSNAWKAEFSRRTWSYFLIRFWRLEEYHLLEFRLSKWRLVDKVALDGRVVYAAMSLGLGRKALDFQVGSHADRFQLKFHATWFFRLKTIQLRVDDRIILSSN